MSVWDKASLELSGKMERFSRYIKRKIKNPKAKRKKVQVLTEQPEWVPHSFFSYKVLRKRYQTLLLEHLKEQIRKELNTDTPDPDLRPFSEPSVMTSFFDDLKKEYKNGFFVYVSEERKDLKSTAGYIGRYARRPPLSEVRIKDYTGDMVTFEHKDYKLGTSEIRRTLRTFDFIRKLIRHIPDHYFNVIRHFGLLASRVKGLYKEITDRLLPSPPESERALTWRERQTQFLGTDPLVCKICHRVMQFVSNHIPNPIANVKEKLRLAFC